MKVDEIRLAIKLMIHSFKREGDSTFAFQEYTKVCQASAPMGLLKSLLLQDLKELLDTLEPAVKSGDEPVLGILRQALSAIASNRYASSIYQAFLGSLINYFCQSAQKRPSQPLAQQFINLVIRLTKLQNAYFAHFGYAPIEHLSTLKDYNTEDFVNLCHVMTQCFLRETLPSLTEAPASALSSNPPAMETVSVSPQRALEVIERLQSPKKQKIDLAIALLSGNSDAVVHQAALAEGQQATEEQKSVVSIMKKQLSLSSLIAQKCTSVPLDDCLAHGILSKLISEKHWNCIFLMRLVLLFLKQAQKIAPLEEVTQVGVDMVDQILAARPWAPPADNASKQNLASFWPNLKRGLCFFAAEYTGKAPGVAAVYRKHLLPDEAMVSEFCAESPVMKDMLIIQEEKPKEEEAKEAAEESKGE